jgi:TM2 domain-containing membrane protein YozV
MGRFAEPAFRANNNRNVVVALLLLLTLGMLGAHRLYLGLNRSAYIQLSIFAFGLMFGLFTLHLTLFLWCIGILSIWLLADIVVVIVMLR